MPLKYYTDEQNDQRTLVHVNEHMFKVHQHFQTKMWFAIDRACRVDDSIYYKTARQAYNATRKDIAKQLKDEYRDKIKTLKTVLDHDYK